VRFDFAIRAGSIVHRFDFLEQFAVELGFDLVGQTHHGVDVEHAVIERDLEKHAIHLVRQAVVEVRGDRAHRLQHAAAHPGERVDGEGAEVARAHVARTVHADVPNGAAQWPRQLGRTNQAAECTVIFNRIGSQCFGFRCDLGEAAPFRVHDRRDERGVLPLVHAIEYHRRHAVWGFVDVRPRVGHIRPAQFRNAYGHFRDRLDHQRGPRRRVLRPPTQFHHGTHPQMAFARNQRHLLGEVQQIVHPTARQGKRNVATAVGLGSRHCGASCTGETSYSWIAYSLRGKVV